jgi:hypothetical protein
MPWTSANGRATLEGFLSACDPIGEMALAGAPARLMARDQHNRGWQRLGDVRTIGEAVVPNYAPPPTASLSSKDYGPF